MPSEPDGGYIPRCEETLVLDQADLVRTLGESRAVLLYGVGGVGKTRMVRALAARGGRDGDIRWVPPIDVDDSEFWLLENLQRAIADTLDPDRRFFAPFLNYLSQLPQYSARRVGRDTIASHHARMRELFVECYQDFVASTGATVAVTFDTVETIRSTYLVHNLVDWMRSLPRTLFVLSGRPTANSFRHDPIREHLADPPDPLVTVEITLNGFSDSDARTFLDMSVLGGILSPQHKDRLIALTEGHPLWLILAVDYLQRADPPAEMTETAPVGKGVREAFRRRLVTPYRSVRFWPEAIKRLAVVRHGVDRPMWQMLMDDRDLPAGVADWDHAWRELRDQPWIRPRFNDRYVTLHDALAEELCLRLIPLHDQDMTWRVMLWEKAARVYARLVGDDYPTVLDDLAVLFEAANDLGQGPLLERVARLDVRKRELDQLRTASLYYLLLSDFPTGTERFTAEFSDAAARHDLHFQELACHELERFLPPGQEAGEPMRDAVGVRIEQFRAWLAGEPARHLEIGIDIARFFIQNAQPRAAVTVLDRLPADLADDQTRYRLANERGNATMAIPGEVQKARRHFDEALEYAARLPSPARERCRAEAFKELGYYARNLGRWTEANKHYRAAHEVISTIVGPGRAQSDRGELASIQANWAYLKALQGHYDEARNLADSALYVRRQLGNEHQIAISLSISAEVHRYERRFTAAWSDYGQAQSCFETLRNWPWMGLLYQEQAICLVQAHEAGQSLVEDPVGEAKRLIGRAVEICHDHAVRWYPSALNRAGRIHGREDVALGLRYLDSAITEARRLADGWFLSASLSEYLELAYRAWLDTRDPALRALLGQRVADVEAAIEEYDFHDLKARWELLQGHLLVHDAVDSGRTDRLDEAIQHYSTGFLGLADRRIGSHGSSAIAEEFSQFHDLFGRLQPDIQARWYDRLRHDWSPETLGFRSTLLLARLEQLY
jgi:tetratricopeptide (TPR) repeat protein